MIHDSVWPTVSDKKTETVFPVPVRGILLSLSRRNLPGPKHFNGAAVEESTGTQGVGKVHQIAGGCVCDCARNANTGENCVICLQCNPIRRIARPRVGGHA